MNKIQMPSSFPSDHAGTHKEELVKALDFFIRGDSHIDYTAEMEDKILLKFLRRLLKLNKYNLLSAPPERLEEITKKIDDLTRKCNISKNGVLYSKILPKIFDYEKFKENEIWEWTHNKKGTLIRTTKKDKIKGRSDYLRALNLNCCPYCNRNYIMTADIKVARSPKPKKSEGIKVQPALDHYWSQKDYPYLAISLYNLIPSCYLCNSIIKRDHKLSYSEHIHPYSHSLHKKVFFDVKIKNIKAFLSDPNEFEIEIKQKNHKDAQRGINSAEFFGLKDLFNQHKDYVAEILLKKQAYTKDWLATVKSLTKLNITLEDAMRVYYGNYLKEEDIDKRPLSKLTIDIIFGKSGTPSTNGGGGGILTPSSINS